MFVPQEGAAVSARDSRRARLRDARSLGATAMIVALLVLTAPFGRADDGRRAELRSAESNRIVKTTPDDATADDTQPPKLCQIRIHLGDSVQGAPIDMDLFGDGPDRILIVGGLHGDEPNGARIAERLAEHLRTHPELAAGRTIGIVARANPDGLKTGTRTNANGVDLNRNFPTRDWRSAELGELSHGDKPSSEPETRALVAAARRVSPQRLIDVHSISGGEQCNNYDGSALELATLMSERNGYPISADIGYPTPGALGCWAGIDLKIPAVTLELPRGANPTDCWRDNAEALLAAIRLDEVRSMATAGRPTSAEARK